MSCVYKHTFPNGAVYIGKTNIKPEDRWLNGWGYKQCPLMFNAILKYGWDNVEHEIIEDNLTEKEALELEEKLITEYALHSTLCTDTSTESSTEQCTMLYNIKSIPPQYIASETSHFISTLKPTTEHKLVDIPLRTRYKEYIIPITNKPSDKTICPIDVYTVDGRYICTYPSAKIASSELNVNHGDIISCCRGKKSDGKPRYQAKGYIFRYSTIETPTTI